MKEKKFDILMLFQAIFVVPIMMFISVYGLITENYEVVPLTLILVSAMAFITGLREYKRNKNLSWAIYYFGISLFILFCAFEKQYN